jgi:hypothetical protein
MGRGSFQMVAVTVTNLVTGIFFLVVVKPFPIKAAGRADGARFFDYGNPCIRPKRLTE